MKRYDIRDIACHWYKEDTSYCELKLNEVCDFDNGKDKGMCVLEKKKRQQNTVDYIRGLINGATKRQAIESI